MMAHTNKKNTKATTKKKKRTEKHIFRPFFCFGK